MGSVSQLKKTETKFYEKLLDIVKKSSESVPKTMLPTIVSLAIINSKAYQRSMELQKADEATEYLKIARPLTDFIYTNKDQLGKNPVFPEHFMDDSTETGSLGLFIEPNKDYSDSQEVFYLIKEVDSVRGRQIIRDSQHFEKDSNFNLEHIVANIPLNDQTSYLWKEYVIGPDLRDLFQTMDNGILRGNEEEQKILGSLEEAILNIAVQRVLYWQENSPDSTEVPKNPESVITDYKRKMIQVLSGFSEFTDIDYTQNEIDNVREALDGIDFSFINGNTIARNVAADLKNIVQKTGKLNISYPEIINLFTLNGGKKRINRQLLNESLYFVDPPIKYSHVLEDPWEMDISREGQVPRKAVSQVIKAYKDKGIEFAPRDQLFIGSYRTFRKAYLILSKFNYKNHEKFNAGIIDKDEFDEKRLLYCNHMNHLLGQGQNFLLTLSDILPTNERISLSVVASALQKLGTYTTINYQTNKPINSTITS